MRATSRSSCPGPTAFPYRHRRRAAAHQQDAGRYLSRTRSLRDRFLPRAVLRHGGAGLGLDRVEFRRRNLVSQREMPYSIATITPFESKDEFDSGDYHATLDRCLDEIDWARRRSCGQADRRTLSRPRRRLLHRGRRRRTEGERAHRARAGWRYSVYVGSSAIGQGLETAFAQIAADALESRSSASAASSTARPPM